MITADSVPLVSVIIPTYNRAETVRRAVDSVLAQTFRDFELIVVDDGSTDNTPQVLEAYGRKVIPVRQERAGVSAARNRGIARSSGALLAFLDSDDAWKPEKLAVQTAFFQEHQEVLICQTEETWIRNGKRVNPRYRHLKPSGDIFLPSLKLCLVSPSAVMMRRELFEKVGLFDEDLPACEDYDLWLRVSARYQVHLIDESLIIKYGGHEDQLSRTTVGLDWYRVRALEKIISSGSLTHEQEQAARRELIGKAGIYGQGCLKRGRKREGETCLALAERHRAALED